MFNIELKGKTKYVVFAIVGAAVLITMILVGFGIL